MIPVHRHTLHAPPRAKLHVEGDHHFVRRGSLLAVIHPDVEVSKALVVVAYPAVPLVQQVVVDRAFLEDWNQMLNPLLAQPCAHYLDSHNRSPGGGESKIGFPGGIDLRLELDVRFQPLLAPVHLQHARKSAVDGLAIHAHTRPQMSHTAKFVQTHAGIASHLHRSHASLRARDHMKHHIDQLLLGMPRQGKFHR